MRRSLTIGCTVLVGATVLQGGTGCATSGRPTLVSGAEARIQASPGLTTISFAIAQPGAHLGPDGTLLVSVEVPKQEADRSARCMASPLASKQSEARGTVEHVQLQQIRITDVVFPPGPDNATSWRTFSLSSKDCKRLLHRPIRIEAQLEAIEPVAFTRVMLGRPSTLYSRILGAFAPRRERRTGDVITPGVDLLGTQTAAQRFRIPANTLAPETEAFDELVDFGDAPFNPKQNNVDTVTYRPDPICVGGTGAVRITSFANQTKSPIRIKSTNGDLFFEVTATLSPSAESTGFMTILPDGTYKTTTALYPLLQFQRVADGRPAGTPIVVDTAVTPVPGFPFYLASDGGRWTRTAREGRLVTPGSSNFFYGNGPVNDFIHSNGVGPGGELASGSCKKASAVAVVH